MKARVLSRGPTIDTEACVRNAGMGRFDLVLAATARSREIKRQNRDSTKFEHVHTVVTALLEIQEGKIDAKEYLAKIK